MKLLRGQTQVTERDGVKIEVKVIDTVMQATIASLSANTTFEGRFILVGYLLKNCVESIEIKGVKYNPIDLATKADISDEETRDTIMQISAMILLVAFSTDEEEKK